MASSEVQTEFMFNKHAVCDLGLFSGRNPTFEKVLHVGRPNVGDFDSFVTLMRSIWDTKLITNRGPLVVKFEQAIAEHLGVKHFISTCNGTLALELAVQALGLHGEVIVPSFTFIATAHCLQRLGVTPVFCDIDPRTHLIDVSKVEALITPRTTGILGVHLWGAVCDAAGLQDICERHNLKLFFDAAHAFGCSKDGVMVGNFGQCEAFSFHATKFFNTFEGGGVGTNDDALAEKIKRQANFGFVWYDDVREIGTNGKMIEPCAAMGLVSLQEMPTVLACNRAHYELYCASLASIPGMMLYQYEKWGHLASNYQYVVFEVDETGLGLSRDELLAVLVGENVSARRYFYPGCHGMAPYRQLYPEAQTRLPVTEALCANILCFPTGTGVTSNDIRAIEAIIRFASDHAVEIKARLAGMTGRLPICPAEVPGINGH